VVAEDQDQLTYTWAQQRAGPACALSQGQGRWAWGGGTCSLVLLSAHSGSLDD